MPNIRQDNAPQGLGLNPSEIGVEATASAARRGGQFFNQAGQDFDTLGQRVGSAIRDAGDAAVKYEDHREIAAGAKDLAARISNLTDQWNQTAKNADPNDPSVAAKFRETVLEPALDEFAGNFHTEAAQNWAQGHVTALRDHMFEKTAADMSTLAGQAAQVNHTQTVNLLSNTVHSDPSSLSFSLDTLKTSTGALVDSSPNLTGVAGAKVKSELLQAGSEKIIKSAALGYIEKTGQVPDWASDPKYAPYIDGAELKQLAQAARYYQRLGQSEDRAARVQQDYENKNDFNQKINALEVATIPQNVGDKPQLPADYWQKLRGLGTHPGAALEPGRLRTMIENGERLTDRLNKPEPIARVSHAATVELLNRIRATDDSRLTDNSEIYKRYGTGDLTDADFNFLNKQFTELRTPQGQALDKDRGTFLKRFEPVIDAGMNEAGTHSLLGTQRSYEFEMDARRQEEDLRKQGKDPHLVYDPRSEFYFGRPENVMKYHASLQDIADYKKVFEAAEKNRTAAPGMPAAGAPKEGDRKQFKQGMGVFRNGQWTPEAK